MMNGMTDYAAVIMAGGGGTRLWPLSRRARPKQILHLFGDRTLFQMAVDRILPIMTPERIFIVTVADQAKVLKEQVSSIPEKNFLLEPSPRGTASVVGLAAIILHEQNPEYVMAVLTADHYIADVERFRDLLLAAYEVACDNELVTLGITPSYPDTGYGYIQRGELLGEYHGFHAYRVKNFKEKPVLSQAEEYIASGDYAWNSGMFVWKVSRILEEIEGQMPDLFKGLKEIEEALGSSEEAKTIEEIWGELESETIDYGVMEGAKQVTVIPADDLGWWDVGGWNRLFELMEQDEMGNLILAPKTLILDTKDTLVYQDPEAEKGRLIATLGLEGVIAIDTGDALLLCQRERAEDLRRLVKELKISGLEEYL
jgi:mannose-1-phosphate guanylyltransferase